MTKFLTAIFAQTAIEKKRNTEAIETAANQLVAGRVVMHTTGPNLATGRGSSASA